MILLETFRYWTILNNIVQYYIELPNIVQYCPILPNIVWYCPILSSIFQMDISSFKIDNSSMIYNFIWILLYVDKISSNIVMYLLILSDIIWYCRILTNIVSFCRYCQLFPNLLRYCQMKSIIVRCLFKYTNIICIKYLEIWWCFWNI